MEDTNNVDVWGSLRKEFNADGLSFICQGRSRKEEKLNILERLEIFLVGEAFESAFRPYMTPAGRTRTSMLYFIN